MKIDLTNYESWFLDYYEGTLSAEKVAELFLFLEQHQNLKDEFEGFEMILLDETSSTDIFENKGELKKFTTPTFSTINEWLIADLEGDLNLQQRTVLNDFIGKNPQFANDKTLFQKSKIKPDLSIVYPDKKQLGKRVIGQVSTMRIWYAVAASLLLLIGAWISFRVITNDRKIQNANNNIAPKIEIPINENQKLATTDDNKENKVEKYSVENKNNLPNKNKITTPSLENSLANNGTSKKLPNNLTLNSENKLAHQNKTTSTKNNNSVSLVVQEEIAFINPIKATHISEEEPFVFAERRYIPNMNLAEYNLDKSNSIEHVSEKVIDDIKLFANTNINKVIGEEAGTTNTSTAKLTIKSKVIRFTGNLISGITNNKVKVKTSFNPINGSLAAYELEIGKKVWQKQF